MKIPFGHGIGCDVAVGQYVPFGHGCEPEVGEEILTPIEQYDPDGHDLVDNITLRDNASISQ